MNIENIKNPEEILKFMNEKIQYGWLDINGDRHVNEMGNFRRLYRTSSIEETVNNGIGTCIEQVNLMHFLLNKINIENKMFCCRIYEPNEYNNLDEDEHMHCFILYYLNNKVYQIEHPNFEKVGIYEYNNEFEALDSIIGYYIQKSGDINRPTTAFFEVPIGISFKEFNNYINDITVKKII